MIDSINTPANVAKNARLAALKAEDIKKSSAKKLPHNAPLTSIEDDPKEKSKASQGAATVTLETPKTTKKPLEQTYGRLASAAERSDFDWSVLIRYLIKENLTGYMLARKERKANLSAQVSALQSKASDIRQEATMELIGGAIMGAAQIGAGVVQGVGGARGLSVMKGADNPQAAAALSQSTQMRFSAVSQSLDATGKVSSSATSYEQTQLRAKETEDETEATRAGTYVSETSEDMQNLWNMEQSALQELKAQIETRHEAAEKSLY